ncbi:MAG: YraN family protein [Nitrospirae bacterium]|nr:MAG: YraN family protein [Nitrospirota bacterium]
MNVRTVLGSEGERAAAAFLEARGYRIRERNYRTRLGELDLVAEEGDTLVFVEVKVRRNDRFGGPAAAITAAKQARIARLAQQYVVSRRLGGRPCRFDVVLIWGADPGTRRIELLPGAFEAPANRSTA